MPVPTAFKSSDIKNIRVNFADPNGKGYRWFIYQQYINRDTGESRIIQTPWESLWMNLPPQGIIWSSPFAQTVTGLLNSGVVAEERGIVVRDLIIRGTTGFRPNTGRPDSELEILTGAGVAGSAQSVGAYLAEATGFNDVVTAVKDIGAAITGAPLNKVGILAKSSGFAAILNLENFFRKYSDYVQRVSGPFIGGNTRPLLVFADYNKGEQWIVVPVKFDVIRNSTSKLTATYEIQCKAIARFNPGGQLPEIKAEKNIIQQLLDYVNRAINTIQSIVALQGAITTFVKNVTKIAMNAVKLVTKAIDALTSIITSALQTFEDVKGMVKETFRELKFACNQFLSLFQDDASSGQDNGIDLTNPALRELYSNVLDIRVISTAVLANPVMVSPSANSSATDFLSRYSDLGLPVPGADQNGIGVAVIQQNDTIYSLATRLLGSPNRWVELIKLNQLKAPYIVSSVINKPSGTLATGEQILYPTGLPQDRNPSTVPAFVVISSAIEYRGTTQSAGGNNLFAVGVTNWLPDQYAGWSVEITSGAALGERKVILHNDSTGILTLADAWTTPPAPGDTFRIFIYDLRMNFNASKAFLLSLGSDARIKKFLPKATTYQLYDLDYDFDVNDLRVIEGLENMKQAIQIKNFTAPGSLPLHPAFGFTQYVGRVGTDLLAQVVAREWANVLQSDPRISDVKNVDVSVNGDLVQINSSEVILKNVATANIAVIGT